MGGGGGELHHYQERDTGLQGELKLPVGRKVKKGKFSEHEKLESSSWVWEWGCRTVSVSGKSGTKDIVSGVSSAGEGGHWGELRPSR